MNLSIPSMHNFTTYFPTTRGFRHESFGFPGRVGLVDYPRLRKNYKISASFDVDEGTTKPLINDLAKLPPRLRGKFRKVWHRSCVTFCNETQERVSLALMPTEQTIAMSGILRLKNLEAGDHLRVPHSDIVNYRKTARNFKIRASINVKGTFVKLLPLWLCRCDAVSFSFTNNGRVFRATYFSNSKEVSFEAVPIVESEAAPDELD